MRIKWDFVNRLSSCEHPSKCPTAGCGVIPTEGRSMCIEAEILGNPTESPCPSCDPHSDSH